jgi:hypothetical protein
MLKLHRGALPRYSLRYLIARVMATPLPSLELEISEIVPERLRARNWPLIILHDLNHLRTPDLALLEGARQSVYQLITTSDFEIVFT